MKLIDNLLSLFYPRLCAACGDALQQNESCVCLNCMLHLPETQFHKNMQNSLSFNSSPYLLITYTLIFLRNSCFFAWFLVLDLYSSLKATFKKKQQVSVLEHQTVQFSLPDNIEASFPLNKILYIQKNGHTTQLHCVDDEVFTISDPFSYCKETIPSSLWTLENGDKMVFHRYYRTIISTDFGDGGNAHSEYIGPCAESGIPGMLTVFAIVFTFLIVGIKTYIYTEDKTLKLLSLCMVIDKLRFHIFAKFKKRRL